jgi:DNA replication protein DnaC
MRRYERASSLITSNRPVEDWGKLLGDSAAVSAIVTLVGERREHRKTDGRLLQAVGRGRGQGDQSGGAAASAA